MNNADFVVFKTIAIQCLLKIALFIFDVSQSYYQTVQVLCRVFGLWTSRLVVGVVLFQVRSFAR